MVFEIWVTFLLAICVVSLSPGAGAVAAMSTGLNFGFPAALWTLAGLQCALILQVCLVALGLGIILNTSMIIFEIIKYLGILYLVFLAAQNWFITPRSLENQQQPTQAYNAHKLFIKAMLINLSNPKAIIFMLAVLPQFIQLQDPLLTQYLVMILTMISVDLLVMGAYATFAYRVLNLLKKPSHQTLLNRSFSCMFLLAASALFWFEPSST
ncbi:homoserine/homoserine lactone efflux protein [Allopseudospirillum japonicum]|uniref:Homoserine/homoserine lactone efflux protein n=1 Tax=Allopseudospirillum japonicum TaxID=64971 RepID=A0A1H6Q8U1_9GAMM|nr:LysE family transporter [Allopseudospirillum japonicum]SEI37244.1 homoserine/homoserine lactone efflux protein [Allopseudospirillum japonicum]